MFYNLKNQTSIALAGSMLRSTTLKNTLCCLNQAQTFYTSVVMRSKWVGNKSHNRHSHNNMDGTVETSCWNCGRNHCLGDCKDSLNQATIDKNKKIFYENKKKNDEARGANRGNRGAPKDIYCGKFGKDNGASFNGVMMASDGKVYTQCEYDTFAKGCGINVTHSFKYYTQ